MARPVFGGRVAVGAGTFALSGDHEDMFFGRDSRVTVDMKQDLRQSGSKGFVGKRQTRDWKWTIEVTNSHTQPVAVRVKIPTADRRQRHRGEGRRQARPGCEGSRQHVEYHRARFRQERHRLHRRSLRARGHALYLRKVEKVGGETFFKKLPLPNPPLSANSLTPSF